MSFSERLSNADEQTSALSRRDLLGKFSAITLAATGAKLLPKSFQLPEKYPAPKFAIGDQIFSPWDNGDLYSDEEDEEYDIPPEFGEIMGICWNPRNEAWEYVINWTSGDAAAWMYPVFDEVLICESSLRLAS